MKGKNGAVLLFISGLSEQCTAGELKLMFQKAIRPTFPKCGISCCDMLCITDRDLNRSEFHAMVSIRPAKAALWAIRVLDGSLINNRRIRVRRYRPRNPMRVAGHCTSESNLKERRRGRLAVDLVKPRHDPWLSALSHWIASRPFSRA